jgi:hypothetical protein
MSLNKCIYLQNGDINDKKRKAEMLLVDKLYYST